MKKKLILSCVLLFSIISFSQTFEGEIIYSNSYKSNSPQLKDEQLNTMLGTTQNYLIKGGNYKSTVNGKLMQWQLYINKDNKLYDKMTNSEVVYWNDGSVQEDEITKVEINKDVIEILGYKCDEIIFTCKSGIQKYYYNTKIAVDAKLFINHKFGNWYDFVSRSKALPLKTIIETPQFTLTSIATEIHSKILESSLFFLPQGIQTAKSR